MSNVYWKDRTGISRQPEDGNRCPECKQIIGGEWMIHYHKMGCGKRRYHHEGDHWKEVILGSRKD